MGGVWPGAGAAGLRALMGIFHAPTPSPARLGLSQGSVGLRDPAPRGRSPGVRNCSRAEPSPPPSPRPQQARSPLRPHGRGGPVGGRGPWAPDSVILPTQAPPSKSCLSTGTGRGTARVTGVRRSGLPLRPAGSKQGHFILSAQSPCPALAPPSKRRLLQAAFCCGPPGPWPHTTRLLHCLAAHTAWEREGGGGALGLEPRPLGPQDGQLD